MEISFIVPGQPFAWKRPASKGKMRFTPPKMRAYERLVGFLALNAVRGFNAPWAGPMMLSVVFTMKTPKRGKSHGMPHLSDPDLSNLIKIIEDGMIGVVYKDDNQIAYISASKVYGEKPNVHVIVRSA